MVAKFIFGLIAGVDPHLIFLLIDEEIVDDSILVSDYIQDNSWNLPLEFSVDTTNGRLSF